MTNQAKAKYRASEKGRAKQRESYRRYAKTAKGKAARKRYQQSPKGRAKQNATHKRFRDRQKLQGK